MSVSANVSISVRRRDQYWLCECHLIDEHSIKSIVLGVVHSNSGGERKVVVVVEPLLACLQHAVTVTTYVIEGNPQMGRALAAVSSPVKPLISGAFFQGIVLQLVKDLLLAKFGGLEQFGFLEYFRFRLLAVVDDSFPDRMPLLRRVRFLSYLDYSCLYTYVGACEALQTSS